MKTWKIVALLVADGTFGFLGVAVAWAAMGGVE